MQNNCAAKIAFRIPAQTLISREMKWNKIKQLDKRVQKLYWQNAVVASPSKGSCKKYSDVYLTVCLNKLTKESWYSNTCKDNSIPADRTTWKAQNESVREKPKACEQIYGGDIPWTHLHSVWNQS